MPSTFRKSLRLLLHPISLGAMGVMLLNDFVLKSLAPSWWTGKLSDLAGLIFLPFLAAALIAWLVPPRPRYADHADRVTAIFSLAAVALGFSLLKLNPAFNASFFAGIHALSGLSLHAAVDPSDLIALPTILIPACIWFSPKLPSAPSLRWAYLALPLSALILLADAAAPDYGISCLQMQDHSIIAYAAYGRVFESTDGGMQWQPTEQFAAQAQQDCYPRSEAWQTVLTAPNGRQFRITGGKSIERSTDDGATWQTVFQPASLSEAETSYLKRTRSGNLLLTPGPYAGIIDPASSNLVVAMGQEGVLIGKPDDTWTWVPVGSYRHGELQQVGLSAYFVLLANEILLALAAALLWWSTAALRLERPIWLFVLTILGWVGCAAVAFVIQPGLGDSGYFAPFAFLGLLIALLWTIGLVIAHGFRHHHFGRHKEFLRLALYLPLVFVLVLLPFVLWALNLIQTYWIASLASGLLWIACAVLIKPPSRAQ